MSGRAFDGATVSWQFKFSSYNCGEEEHCISIVQEQREGKGKTKAPAASSSHVQEQRERKGKMKAPAILSVQEQREGREGSGQFKCRRKKREAGSLCVDKGGHRCSLESL